MEYKKPLTLDKQIEHLEKTKRVQYSRIDKKTAQSILYQWNYINVISPFKIAFAKKDKNGHPVKKRNKHIYPRTVEFKEYYDLYKSERRLYPTMYKRIMIFEEHFNAILSYEVLHYYKITNSNKFNIFQNILKKNIKLSNYSSKAKKNMLREINDFNKSMNKYENIYIFLDRMSLSRLITVFRACDNPLKQRIFDSLYKNGYALGYVDLPTFDADLLDRIVQIRNCICHGNSIQVLLTYYDIKSKSFRNKSDKKRYTTIIKRLTD